MLPSHLALLVPSVHRAAARLAGFGFRMGPAELWEGEGTLEIYVEPEAANALLLMEPARAGAYQRAMEKRGPGLHHVAVDVASLTEFLPVATGAGWQLHPASEESIAQLRTAWLFQRGFPGLIEVQERQGQNDPPFARIALPGAEAFAPALAAIGLGGVVFGSSAVGSFAELALGEHKIALQELF